MRPQEGAGRYRHRVWLMRKLKVETGKGGFTSDWSPVFPFRAEVVALSGREAMVDQVLEGVRVYRVTTRWRADILLTDQLRLADGTLLNVRSADDPKGLRRDLEIVADTLATTGG
jgi:head-tail adaptor